MSETVKRMISEDMILKEELISEFKKIARKQIITVGVILVLMVIVIIGFLYYFTKPTKADILVFKQIQKERELIRVERDSLRYEKEILLGIKKKNPYAKPKYDTIK